MKLCNVVNRTEENRTQFNLVFMSHKCLHENQLLLSVVMSSAKMQ
jgi:hypothetical protein